MEGYDLVFFKTVNLEIYQPFFLRMYLVGEAMLTDGWALEPSLVGTSPEKASSFGGGLRSPG